MIRFMSIFSKYTNRLFLTSSTGLVFTNTFYQLLGKVFSMAGTVLITMFITKSYGLSGYGYFNLMQSIPAIFFIISDFGFNAVAAKDLTDNWDKAQKYFFNILILRIVLSLILMVLVFLSIWLFFPYPADLKFGIYLSLFLILTQALYASGNLIFQLKLKYDYSVLGYLTGYVLIMSLSFVLIALKVNIVWVNFTYVLGGLLTFLVSLRLLKKLGIVLPKQFSVDLKLWKKLLITSAPIGLTFVFSQVNFRADAILLSRLSLPASFGYTSVETVAVYGLAYKIFEVCLVVPTFFMNAVYPLYVSRLVEGKSAFMALFKKSVLVLSGAGFLASIFGILLAPTMIKILGGEQFFDSVFTLRVLFVGILVFFVSVPFSWFIVTLGKQKYLPVIYMLAAVFNIVCNIMFIPKYSYLASAYLTWISELIIFILLVVFSIIAWKKYNAELLKVS